jgi:hypothetical protein
VQAPAGSLVGDPEPFKPRGGVAVIDTPQGLQQREIWCGEGGFAKR